MPQENAVDRYPKVRLEAGALHLANYLILDRGLFLDAKVTLFLESAKKHLANCEVLNLPQSCTV